MKRLNRKGFTLVELLAVIVILAIVVGIALVTILPTLENSRQKSFDVAVDSIVTYINEQKDMSLLSSDLRGDTYNSGVAEATCIAETPGTPPTTLCTGDTGSLLDVTGYKKNITAIKWYYDGGRAKITCATAATDGDYRQGTKYSTAC